MPERFTVQRTIHIDAGHRVPDHDSHCRNLHGHRYTVSATWAAEHLVQGGPQRGMVHDFGRLKRLMMDEIHTPCDHAFIMSVHDRVCQSMFAIPDIVMNGFHGRDDVGIAHIVRGPDQVRVYIIHDSPTAENLARHWAYRLRTAMRNDLGTDYAQGMELVKVSVWETPNSLAEYFDEQHRTS